MTSSSPAVTARERMSWQELGSGARELAEQIVADGYRPDIILGIARGGLLVAGALSYALDVKNTFTMNVEFYTGIDERLPVPMLLPPVPELVDLHDARMLIADDVADTGPDARARQGLLRRPGRRGARGRALREAEVDRGLRVRLEAHRALDRLPLVDRAARQRLSSPSTSPGSACRPSFCFEKTTSPSAITSNWLLSPSWIVASCPFAFSSAARLAARSS